MVRKETIFISYWSIWANEFMHVASRPVIMLDASKSIFEPCFLCLLKNVIFMWDNGQDMPWGGSGVQDCQQQQPKRRRNYGIKKFSEICIGSDPIRTDKMGKKITLTIFQWNIQRQDDKKTLQGQ